MIDVPFGELAIGDPCELDHTRRIVIADEESDLLGRVRSEPAQHAQTLGARHLGRCEVVIEVIADRDQLDVAAQHPVAAEVIGEQLHHRGERRLRIAEN